MTALFAERGYQAVTMRAIGREAGCSAMTPYRYFAGGKAEIFAMVKAGAFRAFAEQQEKAASGTHDPLERVWALGRAYVDFGLRNRDAYRVMFQLRRTDDTVYPELAREERRAWLPLRSAVEAAVNEGALAGDAGDLAHLFWAKVHGLVSLHLAGKLKQGRSIDQLVRSMTSGWIVTGGERRSTA